MTEINSRQFTIIAIFLVMTSKVVTMPSVIYALANEDAIFSIAINFAIELLLIFLICQVIKHNPHKSLFEVLRQKFTIVGAYIIITLIVVYLFCSLFYAYQELYSFFVELLYDNLSPLVFALPTIFVVSYLAIKGIRTLARTFEILFWFILIGGLISLACNLEFVTFTKNMPYFLNGLSPTLNGVINGSFYFGNSICLLFLVGKVNFTKNTTRNTMLACLGFALLITGACFIFYDVFGKSMQYVIFALSEYAQYDPFILELQRLVWLSTIVDLTQLFCSTACIAYSLGQGTKDLIHTRTTFLPIILVHILAYLVAVLSNYDLLFWIQFVKDYISLYTLILVALLMILCVIILIRRRTNEQKSL